MVPSCRRWLLFILATAVLVALVPSDGLTHDATGGRRLSFSPHAAKPRSTALDGPAASRAAVTRDRRGRPQFSRQHDPRSGGLQLGGRATAANAASAAGAAAARRTATATPSPASRSRAAVAAARARVRTAFRARPATAAAVIDRAPNPTTLRQRLRGVLGKIPASATARLSPAAAQGRTASAATAASVSAAPRKRSSSFTLASAAAASASAASAAALATREWLSGGTQLVAVPATRTAASTAAPADNRFGARPPSPSAAKPTSGRCFVVKMKLWGTHSDARMGEGVRWLAEVVLPSVDAAAKFHAKCCHSARKPPVFHDAFLLMDGSYSLNRTRLQALKTRFPSWLHIFTSRAAAADGAKRVLLDQRRCEWLTFVRLDADDMLTQEAFERIEQSASVSKGDVTVHGAGLLDMVTLYDEGKSLQCEHESRRRNFQMSVEEKRLKWKHLLSSLITLLNEFISKGSRSRWRRRCGGLFGPPMRCMATTCTSPRCGRGGWARSTKARLPRRRAIECTRLPSRSRPSTSARSSRASLSRSGWRGSARRSRPCSRGCRTSSSLATRRQRSRPAASRCAPRLEGQRRGCCFARALPP